MEKDIFKKYPDYVCMSYLRWLFLIQSEQYLNYYHENQINKLIKEKESLIKKRHYFLSQMEEDYEGKLQYKYNKACEDALNDNDIDDRVEEIIEEKTVELTEGLDSVQQQLSFLSKKSIILSNEARKRFKLRVKGNDIKQLKPVDEGITFGLDPRFYGHKAKPLSGIEEKKFFKGEMFKNAAVHQITSLDSLKKITKDAEILTKINKEQKLIKPLLLEIDTHYPCSFLVDVFKEKIKEIQRSESINIKPEGRARLKEWLECLSAYIFSKKQKITYLEIGRLLGATITSSSFKITCKLSEINKKDWKVDAYGKMQITDNIKKKVDRAKELINMAGEGNFPGFDNQFSQQQAEKSCKSYEKYLKT